MARSLGGMHQMDMGGIDDDLATMLEIDRDPGADHRLHLSQPPVVTGGVANQVAGFEYLCRFYDVF